MINSENRFNHNLKLMSYKDDHSDASALQNEVREAERVQRGDYGVDYSSAHVRQAVVHTREDLVLLVSRLASLNKSAHKITTRLNILILIGVALIALLWI